jgi:hypothetical protein
MKEIFIFILTCYGATMILVYGKVFESTRDKIHSLDIPLLSYFIRCSLCTGFYVGFFASILQNTHFGVLTAGFVSSGTSYLLSKIVSDEGIVVKIGKD